MYCIGLTQQLTMALCFQHRKIDKRERVQCRHCVLLRSYLQFCHLYFRISKKNMTCSLIFNPKLFKESTQGNYSTDETNRDGIFNFF
jgi:hypothetical protein